MMNDVRSPLQAVLAQWCTQPGRLVRAGDVVAIVEAMKMEHEIAAPCDARVGELCFSLGEMVEEGAVLLRLEPARPRPFEPSPRAHSAPAAERPDPAVRPDLQKVLDRLAFTQDVRRPEAMARRHALGLCSGRENVADLCDPGTPFDEFGAMAIAAQRGRRSLEDLIAQTPADGLITGVGSVNGHCFAADKARTAIMAYDPTVLAGTQGKRGHQKADRILQVARRHRLPLVLFAEGGGGRPGDDDVPVVAGLHMTTFANFAQLNGHVPTVGIAAGRCFAGNAALLGCCDVIIASRGSNIGMGGPAMVEGGGLGVFTPEQIGPAAVQHGNGVVDVLVDDEAEAVKVARHYLSFFQGSLPTWTVPDPFALRDVVPQNRLRAYDSHAVMSGLADVGSLLVLRAGFGRSIHTALGRIEGRPVGLMASNPQHLGGAIDADAADKAARFMRLCSHYGIPLVSLVDTPGFMVGPDIEERAQVRHTSRMFIAAAHLRVPFLGVILRKAYGLGAMALTAGGFHAPSLTVAWPTGEFGGMGLEGYVRLGYRRELETLPAGPEREALFQRLVQERHEAGSAVNMATTLEIDAVIDPAETRSRLVSLLAVPAEMQACDGRLVDSW
jgi:acetyl-CoA carboxylase carboxyltransferase component